MPFIFGLFGLIIGSFLNVLILREGKEPITGRSKCPSCGTMLAWYDLIPLFSFLILRGRCRTCGHAISFQYPLVEAGTAILFVCIALSPITLVFKLIALPIAALFLAIAVHDFYTTIIPDVWVFLLGLLTLSAALFGVVENDGSYLFAILAGPLTALPLWSLWFFSRGNWMGLGDAKLALSIGWLLGIAGGIQALLLAFMIGAVVSLPLLILSSAWWKEKAARFTPTRISQRVGGRFTMKSEIPFGPFLVVSTFLVWFAAMYGIVIPIMDFGWIAA